MLFKTSIFLIFQSQTLALHLVLGALIWAIVKPVPAWWRRLLNYLRKDYPKLRRGGAVKAKNILS